MRILIALWFVLAALCSWAGMLQYVTAGNEWASPLPLGSRLAGWYDASDQASVRDSTDIQITDGGLVYTWRDKSGNDRHAVAAGSNYRPTWRAGVQNGLGVLRSDGADQMVLSDALGVFRNKTAGHIFIVAKDSNSAGGASYHVFIQWDRNTSGAARASIYGRHISFTNGWVGAARRLDADTTAAATVFGAQTGHARAHVCMDWGGGYLRMQINGSAYTSTAFSSGAGTSSDTDSAQAYFMADLPSGSEIAEIIVVNAAMSTDEIQAINNYLRKKWGTP